MCSLRDALDTSLHIHQTNPKAELTPHYQGPERRKAKDTFINITTIKEYVRVISDVMIKKIQSQTN